MVATKRHNAGVGAHMANDVCGGMRAVIPRRRAARGVAVPPVAGLLNADRGLGPVGGVEVRSRAAAACTPHHSQAGEEAEARQGCGVDRGVRCGM